MKKFLGLFLTLIFLTSLAIGCVGCDTNVNNTDGKESDNNLGETVTPSDNEVTEHLTLSRSALELKVGEQSLISATVSPADTVILWKSSNESIAIVSSNGNVTALSEGKSVITATTVSGKASASCSVTVTKVPESVSIVLSKTQLEMGVGDSYTLSAMVTPSDSKLQVTWSSSNEGAVTVKGGVLQAIAPGTSFIQAKAGNATAVCTVEVKEVFGSISGTFTCKNYNTFETGVDIDTHIYLISDNAKDVDLMKIVWGWPSDRDDIYATTVDTLGNYKFDNIKLGSYRMIVVCTGFSFRLYPADYSVSNIKRVFGDVYNRGTDDSQKQVDEFSGIAPSMVGFSVNVGKNPLTINGYVFGVSTGADVL